jgi:NAD(P) transhydrogenase
LSEAFEIFPHRLDRTRVGVFAGEPLRMSATASSRLDRYSLRPEWGVKIDTIIRFTGNPKSFADQKTLCCLRSLSIVDVLDNRDLARRESMFYDVLVIGNEEEGLDRAISAARVGRRVGIVAENRESVSLNHMRCAAMSLQRSANGGWTMGDWRQAAIWLSQEEAVARLATMEQLGIERLEGTARLISSASVEVADAGVRNVIFAKEIVLACGTRSRQPVSFACDGVRVLVAESLLNLDALPQTSIVIGAGSTGVMTASLLADLGVETTLVDERASLLDLFGRFDQLLTKNRAEKMTFRFGEEAIGAELGIHHDSLPSVRLSTGRLLFADVILVCVGREGNTDQMQLDAVGVGVDEHGRLWCDGQGKTWCSQITAVGDLIGFKPDRLHDSMFRQEMRAGRSVPVHVKGATGV